MKYAALIIYLALVTVILQHQYPFSWDSAEFVNDAKNGWFTHPPGAPVYSFIIQRINPDLLSIAASLIVVICTYYLSKKVAGTSMPVYLLVSAPLFLMNYWWIETYMLSLALVMMAVVVFTEWSNMEHKSIYPFIISTIFLGFAVGVYPSAAFVSVFFISSILLDQRIPLLPRIFPLAILFALLSASSAFVAYVPIMREAGSVDAGITWVSSIAGEVMSEPFNAYAILKRSIVTLAVWGGASVLALMFLIRGDRPMIPYALTLIPFAIFIYSGTAHFQEHMLLPLPFICVLGGYYAKNLSLLKYPLVAVLLICGILTALLIGGVYAHKDMMLNTQFAMINYLPSGTVVLDLANYEHTNQFMSQFYNIYALGNLEEIGTDREMHTKAPYGSTGKFWGFGYDTIQRRLNNQENVMVFNTAFLDPKVEESIRMRYNLTEAATVELPETREWMWQIVNKPASLRFNNITMYRLHEYGGFKRPSKNGCAFQLKIEKTDDISGELFPPRPGCLTGGVEIIGTKFCFDGCPKNNVDCVVFRNYLTCELK